MADRAGDLKLVLFLILERERSGRREILLQRRQNTGYMDGKYDFAASGHLKAGESVEQAMRREAKEELGIIVGKMDYKMLVQDVKEGYFKCVFLAREKDWRGTPEIMEPRKCSELRWYALEALPEDEMIWYLPEILEDIEVDKTLRIFE